MFSNLRAIDCGIKKKLGFVIRRRRANWMFKQIAPLFQPGSSVLDVGAGDCMLAQLIRDQAGCSPTCVDVIDENWTDLPLKRYDGRQLPFPDQSFDYMLVSFVLHHCIELDPVLDEIRRVCRKRIVVLEDRFENVADRFAVWCVHEFMEKTIGMPADELRFKTATQWRQLFEERGFNIHLARKLGYHAGIFPTVGILFMGEIREECDCGGIG